MNLSFFQVLTIIFVIAQVGGFIQWPWGLVFAPYLLEVGLGLLNKLLDYLAR